MPGKQVQLKTVRFGEITVDTRLIIAVPKGLLGFESSRSFVIIETPDSEPFKWFQSLDDPALAFVIVNPLVFFADYRIDVDPRELSELELSDPGSVMTYVIVSVPDGDMSRMSVNLQGPVVICTKNNLAKQLVLVNGPYSTTHPLLPQLGGAGESTVSASATKMMSG
jgi:flagellar assembly factor FliW